jgi:hypothetical protein
LKSLQEVGGFIIRIKRRPIMEQSYFLKQIFEEIVKLKKLVSSSNRELKKSISIEEVRSKTNKLHDLILNPTIENEDNYV